MLLHCSMRSNCYLAGVCSSFYTTHRTHLFRLYMSSTKFVLFDSSGSKIRVYWNLFLFGILCKPAKRDFCTFRMLAEIIIMNLVCFSIIETALKWHFHFFPKILFLCFFIFFKVSFYTTLFQSLYLTLNIRFCNDGRFGVTAEVKKWTVLLSVGSFGVTNATAL